MDQIREILKRRHDDRLDLLSAKGAATRREMKLVHQMTWVAGLLGIGAGVFALYFYRVDYYQERGRRELLEEKLHAEQAVREKSAFASRIQVGGKGHSCGIYSFNDDHINQLALMAPVSRIMIRQPQSKANAGAFNNGMPMTSSLGCGTWGGNSTSENIHLKHYMNVTWVSRPIPEDRPSEQELFGEFYNTQTY